MNQIKVIALVGMAGSGKGTCTTYLSEKYNIPVVHLGNMMYEEVQRRGLDNVKDEKFVREDMRRIDGPAVLAKHGARKVQAEFQNGGKAAIIDGLYSWSELKYLRETFGDTLLTIAVAAPRALRYQRAAARKDSHRQYTEAMVEQRDIAEIENLEKGGPIAFADYTLLNNSSKDHLLEQFEEVLEEVKFLR